MKTILISLFSFLALFVLDYVLEKRYVVNLTVYNKKGEKRTIEKRFCFAFQAKRYLKKILKELEINEFVCLGEDFATDQTKFEEYIYEEKKDE